jgi:hypothetical protein
MTTTKKTATPFARFDVLRLENRINRLRKELDSRIKETRTVAKKRTLELGDRVIKLERTTAESAFKLVDRVHDRVAKGIVTQVEKVSWLPTEAKAIVVDWTHLTISGRKGLQNAVYRTLDHMADLLSRIKAEDAKPVVKKAAKAPKKKPAGKAVAAA